MSENNEKKTPSLEETFLQIEEIIEKMENQEVSLEESFLLYKEGVTKLNNCNTLLDEVEKKMQILNVEGVLEEM